MIDPRSMRFEALVSADQLGERASRASRCSFRVNGYGDQEFAGKVRRVEPGGQRDHAPGRGAGRLRRRRSSRRSPGLYAEGRVETESAREPDAARQRGGARRRQRARLARRRTTSCSKVAVELGERDARSGDFRAAGGPGRGRPGDPLPDRAAAATARRSQGRPADGRDGAPARRRRAARRQRTEELGACSSPTSASSGRSRRSSSSSR